MTKIAGAIIVVLGMAALLLLSAGRIDITREEGWIDWDPATPQPTLDVGDAAANATMVAQQQSAQMTASAAQSEMQATAQAAVAQATKQAMAADQAHLDGVATRRAESTSQAICATVEHERFVVAAASAAEATRAQSTAAAATATRQVEEDWMTATVESRNATATQQAIEREEREKIRKYNSQARKEWGINALFVVLVVTLVLITSLPLYLIALLLRQCLRCTERCMGQWPSTWRALVFIYKKHARRKECKKKTTPS